MGTIAATQARPGKTLTLYFDAFLCRTLNVIQLGDDDYALYASGRRNFFGTALAARGPETEIRAEYKRCAMR